MMFPKSPRQENKALLAMARDQLCLLRVGPCSPTDTTVACHSNWSEHGKGGHIKAHDFWTVWGCARCHSALDGSYAMDKDAKKAAFMAAHERQIVAWKQIAETGSPKDKKTALWALMGWKEAVLKDSNTTK